MLRAVSLLGTCAPRLLPPSASLLHTASASRPTINYPTCAARLPTPPLASRAMSSDSKPAQPEWVDDVLHFWFKQFGPAEWFAGGAHVDALCREHYLPLWSKLAQASPTQACSDCAAHPKTALAAIIVYDQFSRNMFRKTPEAFATDPQALALSKEAVAKGYDKDCTDPEKLFLYMPHMHSESLADQDAVVGLIEAMGNHDGKNTAVEFAKEHRDIVAKFGRFPHRNALLGRKDTPEEEEFLRSHKGFGQ